MSGNFSSTIFSALYDSSVKSFDSAGLESLEQVEKRLKAAVAYDAAPISMQSRMLEELEKQMDELEVVKEADGVKAKRISQQTAELAEVKLINKNLAEEVTKLKELLMAKSHEMEQQEELYKNCCWEMTKTSQQVRKELLDVKTENRNFKVQTDEMFKAYEKEAYERVALKQENENLKYQLDQLGKTFESTKTAALDRANADFQKMEQQDEKLEDVQKELTMKKKKIEMLEGEVEELTEENKELLELFEKTVDEMEEKLRKEQQTNEFSKRKIEELEAQKTQQGANLEKDDQLMYAQVVEARRKRIAELEDEVEKLKAELGQKKPKETKPSLQDQLTGKWKNVGFESSTGFNLPLKFHSWISDTLVYQLTYKSFRSLKLTGNLEIRELDVILGTPSFTNTGSRQCTVITEDALLTKETILDCHLTPTDYEIRRFVEDGLLKIRIVNGDEFGVYKFKKIE